MTEYRIRSKARTREGTEAKEGYKEEWKIEEKEGIKRSRRKYNWKDESAGTRNYLTREMKVKKP